MVPTLIPERTIDSLFAFELLSVAPTAMIWSPHAVNAGTTHGAGPTVSPGNPDHQIGGHRRFDVECKTIYLDAKGSWVNEISNRQLNAYVHNVTTPMFYLLPAEPQNRQEPWYRYCATDPDSKKHCIACSNPPASAGAVHSRRWAGKDQHFSTASPERRLQPWFNHWAWCITPRDLLRHLSKAAPLPWSNTTRVPAADAKLGAIPGAVRFCHLLTAIEDDWRGHTSAPVPTYWPVYSISDADGLRVNLDDWFDAASFNTPARVEVLDRRGFEPEDRARLISVMY